MVRQLKTPNYRKNIKLVKHKNALVIADPELNGFVGQLPGALTEGKHVAKILRENNFLVKDSYNEEHSEILTNVITSYSIHYTKLYD